MNPRLETDLRMQLSNQQLAADMGEAWLKGYDDARAGLPSPGEGVSPTEWAYSRGYRSGVEVMMLERAK